MPTYSYKCKDCEYAFEVRQRMSDDPLTECPNCDDGEVRRVVTPVGVVFKGSGFYITDNRNGKDSASASAVNGASSSGESSSDTAAKSSESKSAESKSAESKKTSTKTEKSDA